MRGLAFVAFSWLLVALTAKAQAPVPLLTAPYIIGSSVYSVREFAPEIAAQVGKPVSTDALESLGAAIRARYVHDGFISPIITIPAQDRGSSTPRLYVLESRIVDFVIKGDPGPYRERIAAYARSLQDYAALPRDSLRQALKRISELPGITSKPLLDPLPDAPNQFRLLLNVSYRPVRGEIDASNGGTHDLGRLLYGGSLDLNGVLGAGEQVQLRAATSSLADRYQYAQAQLSRAFGTNTISLQGAGTAAVPDADTHFSDRNATLGFSHALLSSLGSSLALTAALHGEDGVIHDATNVHLVDDRTRSVALGVEFNHLNASTQTSAYSTLGRGTRIWGASTLDPRDTGVEVAFDKLLFGAAHAVALGDRWRMRLSLDAQATRDILPFTERFAFGGLGFGAAFDPASLVGDSGAGLSAELGRLVRLPAGSRPYATIYARADYGVTWNNADYLPRRDDAASFSVGLLAKWSHVKATLELSTPLRQPEHALPADALRALCFIVVAF